MSRKHLATASCDDISETESELVKSLRRAKEREELLRLKANQKLALLQTLFCSKLKQMNVNVDEIQTINKLKELKRTSPMTKRSMQMIQNNIDEKSRKILTSNKSQPLFEGALITCSKQQDQYIKRCGKLTNDGELVLFETQSTKNVLETLDLVTEYDSIYTLQDTEFELFSNTSGQNSHTFRTETHEETSQWVSNIEAVQYYFKVKSEQKEHVQMHEDVKEEGNTETDPFWLDISHKMDAIGCGRIKECIPERHAMDPKDKKRNKWKEILWTAQYGEFELSCNVQLTCYDTGKWNKDENDILFASVSKYGINSYESWEKIADNLNREVNDVMKKYSKLVGIPLKQLKKTAIAR
eukprot:632596_1